MNASSWPDSGIPAEPAVVLDTSAGYERGMTSPNDETRRIVDDLEDKVVDVDQAAEGDTGNRPAAEDTSPTTPGAEPSG